MEKKKKSLYDYKLGEIIESDEKDLVNKFLKAPIKLVKITYTFQDNDENQMDSSLKHEDYIDFEEEAKKEINDNEMGDLD